MHGDFRRAERHCLVGTDRRFDAHLLGGGGDDLGAEFVSLARRTGTVLIDLAMAVRSVTRPE
jgi:hypothetical protein